MTEHEGADAQMDAELRRLFGPHCKTEGPLMACGGGVRLHGVDLTPRLSPEQAAFLVGVLDRRRIVCIAGQDLQHFSLQHFERLANHFGAVTPHPNNFIGPEAGQWTDDEGSVRVMPLEDRPAAITSRRFPGKLATLPHTSTAVLTVSNFGGDPETAGPPQDPQPGAGGGFHTDIEYEPIPIAVSMFLVHKVPTARTAPDGSWVGDVGSGDPRAPWDDEKNRFYREGRPMTDELHRVRHMHKPTNGETVFVDLAAAFAGLPAEERAALERLQVRRRQRHGEEGWLGPLVRTNPRSGIKSLYSPWNCRGHVGIPPIEVQGMSKDESDALLDRLELQCLQPEFRYNHPHQVGDVTIWDLYATLHAVPPIKSNVDSIDDARLMYRLSTKGEPCYDLPRRDDEGWLAANVATGYTTDLATVNLGLR